MFPIFLYMTPQGLRKVSVGQKPHKHDFPKLTIRKKSIFGEIEICQENRNLAGSGGGLGGAPPPQVRFFLVFACGIGPLTSYI